MNKPIKSWKQTQNPLKWIVETEMSLDELKHACEKRIFSAILLPEVKPTGLWPNKFFMIFKKAVVSDSLVERFKEYNNAIMLATPRFNGEPIHLDAAETKTTVKPDGLKKPSSDSLDWLVEYNAPGYLTEKFFVADDTARYMLIAFQRNARAWVKRDCYHAKYTTCIKNIKTGEQVWPQKNKTWKAVTLLGEEELSEKKAKCLLDICRSSAPTMPLVDFFELGDMLVSDVYKVIDPDGKIFYDKEKMKGLDKLSEAFAKTEKEDLNLVAKTFAKMASDIANGLLSNEKASEILSGLLKVDEKDPAGKFVKYEIPSIKIIKEDPQVKLVNPFSKKCGLRARAK